MSQPVDGCRDCYIVNERWECHRLGCKDWYLDKDGKIQMSPLQLDGFKVDMHRKAGHDVRPVAGVRVQGHHAQCASVQAHNRGERAACNCRPVAGGEVR